MLYINNFNKVLNKEQLSKDGPNQTLLDVRLIYKKALENATVPIIIYYNHSTDNLKSNQVDISLTKNIKSDCELFDTVC
ncbi:MAG: JAB domain-containing protein [Flavobacteriales bacterium]